MSSRISPTANFTSHVWVRNGLSDPVFETTQGRLLYDATRPLMTVARVAGVSTLEPYLLARHARIDELLHAVIDTGEVTQVVELAAGLSGRGLRFARRYGSALTYVETDLPTMAALKRARLEQVGALSATHRVAPVDVALPGGEGSLAALARTLDTGAGVAVITEGLLPYLPPALVTDLWGRIAHVLTGFAAGRYVADLHLQTDGSVPVRVFAAALGVFVGQPVAAHFADAAAAAAALRAAGFAATRVQSPQPLVHILDASTVRPG